MMARARSKNFNSAAATISSTPFEAVCAIACQHPRNHRSTTRREFGTDTGPFILAGLPGINLDQDSPDYKYTHHSAADALEAVKPDVLTQDATIMALTAFWLADRPERFASPWPAEKTAKMLREKGDYDMLKSFNLGPSAISGQDQSTSSN